MDSITQAALGATVAAVFAGKRCNGKVLLAGALLGTLPDLDVLINYGDDISNTVKHRGFSHSLFVLPIFSWFLAWAIHYFKPIPAWSFNRLGLMIMSVLVTHPLLDYFTTYGTQLTWPIPGYYALSSVFIIDPLYTLPLLIGVGFGLIRPKKAAKNSVIALFIATLYLVWSLVAQQIIQQRVDDTVQALALPTESVFITPAPLNTLLWRVVVLDGDSYWEGLASLLDKDAEVRFIRQPRGHWSIKETPEQLIDLQTFSQNYLSYREDNGQLIVSDLRMGMAGNLAFQFAFAERNLEGQWQLYQTPFRYQGISLKGDYGKLIDRLLGNANIDANLGNCAQCTTIETQ